MDEFYRLEERLPGGAAELAGTGYLLFLPADDQGNPQPLIDLGPRDWHISTVPGLIIGSGRFSLVVPRVVGGDALHGRVRVTESGTSTTFQASPPRDRAESEVRWERLSAGSNLVFMLMRAFMDEHGGLPATAEDLFRAIELAPAQGAPATEAPDRLEVAIDPIHRAIRVTPICGLDPSTPSSRVQVFVRRRNGRFHGRSVDESTDPSWVFEPFLTLTLPPRDGCSN
ncbi:MAG TPA: hypothetical protein VEI97_16235 [bacterium]|nr:hypothetical protein [bacterium]